MNHINKNNIEAWLLDYTEGALTPDKEKQLEAYLQGHPEFKSLLENFEPVYLEADEAIVYEKKEQLLPPAEKGMLRYLPSVLPPLLAAAVLLAAIVMILPLFIDGHPNQKLAASLHRAEIQLPEVQSGMTKIKEPLNHSERMAAIAKKPDSKIRTARSEEAIFAAASAPNMAGKREATGNIAGLKAQIGPNFIRKNSQLEYSSLLFAKNGSPVALNTSIPVNDKEKDGRGLMQSILQSEMARAFIPEALEEELPVYASTSTPDKNPVIYLDLPPAGKKLIDRFLKK